MTKTLYSLSSRAGRELEAIMVYTLDTHGQKQASKYGDQLLECIANL